MEGNRPQIETTTGLARSKPTPYNDRQGDPMSLGATPESETASSASHSHAHDPVMKTETAPAHDAGQDEGVLIMLSDKAAEKSIEDSYALRLKVQGGGCSGFSYDLYFDQPQEMDRAFEVKGVKLMCDQMSLMYLVGTEVDYVEGLHGAGFKFVNPNVKSTCGCGSSFSV